MARYSRYLLLSLALLVACGSSPAVSRDGATEVAAGSTTVGAESSTRAEPTGSSSAPTTPESDTTTDSTSPRSRAQGEVPPDLLEGIIAHAASLLGVSAEELDIARAGEAEWPDGAWGCPEPGVVYTQALVRGYWIELQLGDLTLDYRTDGEGRFRLCGMDGTAPPSLQPPVGGEHTETTGFVTIGGDS